MELASPGLAMLRTLRGRGQRKQLAAKLCAAVSARARDPAFFLDYGVPDTLDGRFDVLVLHASLVLEQLRPPHQRALAQALIDALFVHLDEAMREQGVGDIGIARRMKAMAGAFYGRLHAYRDACDQDALAAALLRNVYRGASARVERAERLAKYALVARARLVTCRLDRGELDFGLAPAEVWP